MQRRSGFLSLSGSEHSGKEIRVVGGSVAIQAAAEKKQMLLACPIFYWLLKPCRGSSPAFLAPVSRLFRMLERDHSCRQDGGFVIFLVKLL